LEYKLAGIKGRERVLTQCVYGRKVIVVVLLPVLRCQLDKIDITEQAEQRFTGL